MNFFKPLCAHDLPAFDIIPDAISPASLPVLHDLFINDVPPPLPGQSGSELTHLVHLAPLFEPLRQVISHRFGCSMYLRLDKSSYRVQTPDACGALALHQDYLPLRELILPRWRRSTYKHTDPAREPCCTVWIPMRAIDEQTPTLQVCTRLPGGYVPHVPDKVGYQVLEDPTGYENWPLVTVSQLPAGYGVFLTSLTLHRSCVRPWHTRTRRSLDLRFFPRPAS